MSPTIMRLISFSSLVYSLAVATANPLGKLHLYVLSATTHPFKPVTPRSLHSESATPNFSYDELLKLQNEFWGKFRYPNNIKEAESINSTVFSEDVRMKTFFPRVSLTMDASITISTNS